MFRLPTHNADVNIWLSNSLHFFTELILTTPVTKNISDSQAIKIITEIIGDQSISNLSTMPKPERDILL
jgi:hypothetical protein